MTPEENYLEINREMWNNKTDIHLNSDFYNLEGFLNGETSLNDFELALLGDIRGKKILHLQCHFGQDTISLQRMGAQVTGVDLSDKAISRAKELAIKTNTDCEFICCDVYDLPNHLNEKFDLVFTSYGTIGWLPDIKKWANTVSHFLKPNGSLVFVEFHPVVWMFDDDFKKVTYNYFNSDPIVESETGTYAEKDSPTTHHYVSWNHGLSEVVGSLLSENLSLESLKEYDYSPYDCFRHTIEFEPKKFRIEPMNGKIPMVYSIVARK